jgi:hypothetical protein
VFNHHDNAMNNNGAHHNGNHMAPRLVAMYIPDCKRNTNKMILSDMILPLGRHVAVTARASYVFHCIFPRALHNTKPSHCISSSVDGTPAKLHCTLTV